MLKRTQRLSRLTLSAVAMILFVGAPSYGALVDDLKAYYAFSGNGDDTAGDIPGNANTVDDDASAAGGATTTSTGSLPGFGQYTDLVNSSNQYWDAGNGADLNPDSAGALTVSAWFRVDAFSGGNWQALISHGDASNEYRIARRNGGNNLAGVAGNGDTDNTGPNVNDGLWHHVALGYTDGGVTSLYVDGALAATKGAGGNLASPNNNLFIGENSQAANRHWDGGIDDVAIWHRELTASEVASIYNAGVAGQDLAALLTPAVPEPSTALALVGLTFAGIHAGRRRRRA